ncbi:hypothetical protein FRC03_011112 [Tulasnella sp. 419]|nr:hypothetical protein FRC03_011112 [Tulasnella sp. 419]
MLFFDLLPISTDAQPSTDGNGETSVGNETSKPRETPYRVTSISRPYNVSSSNPSFRRNTRQGQRPTSTSRGLPAVPAEDINEIPESPNVPPPPPYTPIDRNAGLPPLPSESTSIERQNSLSPSMGTPNRRASHHEGQVIPPADRRRTMSSRPSMGTASPATPLFGTPPPGTPGSNVGGFRATMGMPFVGNDTGSRFTRITTVPTPDSQASSSSYMSIPQISSPVSTAPSAPVRRSSIEDPLLLLRKFDTVFIVDDSSSMDGPLWYEAREALAGVADVAARYDADGVDVHFLNNPVVGRNIRSGAEVKRLFDRVTPDGITPTGEKLEILLLDYLDRLEAAYDDFDNGDFDAKKRVRPVNFLVITDGAATDDPESVIIAAARRLDQAKYPLSQVGIQFVQIGDDPTAKEALQQMDDELAAAHGVRDIVDTVPYGADGAQLTAEMLTKILLGGINRRYDRRQTSHST